MARGTGSGSESAQSRTRDVAAASDWPTAWQPDADDPSGDGGVWGSDGNEYWGLYGAAGAIFRNEEDGVERFFLVLCSGMTFDGGVWGSPGGARDRDEDPLAAALRETGEEIGTEPEASEVLFEHVFEPCPEWRYTTFVVAAQTRFAQSSSNWETNGSGWFAREELASMPVHPGVLAAIAAFDASS
jgi:8-oxo-dGTP pyrophosphatase MutT (NUDIX family)